MSIIVGLTATLAILAIYERALPCVYWLLVPSDLKFGNTNNKN